MKHFLWYNLGLNDEDSTLCRLLIAIAVVPLILMVTCRANDVKLDDFYMEYGRYLGGNSHHLAPGYHTKQLPALGFNFKAYKWAYLKNKVTSEVDSTQFRYVALDSELGANIRENVEVYLRHYSGHALDSSYPSRYPSDNSVGVRVHFLD